MIECADLDEAIEVAVEAPDGPGRHDRGAAVLGAVSDGRRRRRRRRVPRRVGPDRRDADPAHRRLGPRRGVRPGRVRRRRSQRWPRDGVPRRPGAWLTTTARNRALDRLRRRGDRARRSCGRSPTLASGRRAPTADDGGGSRRPAAADVHLLPPGAGARGAGGADAAHAGRADDRRDRPGVPRAGGDDGPAAGPGQAQDPPRRHPVPGPARRTCCPSARRPCSACSTCCSTRATPPRRAPTWCARTCAARRSGWPGCSPTLMPDEPEARGLLALMLLHDARRAARVDDAGELVPLEEQDRTRWDATPIAEGVAAARRGAAPRAGRARTSCRPPSRPARRRRRRPPTPTGRRSPRCTAELARLAPTPVVELNRAVAVAMADGPAAGLRAGRRAGAPRRARGYHLLPATRADLLRRLGRRDEAAAAYREALEPGHHRAGAPLPGPTAARGVRRVGIMAGWVRTG